MQRLSAFAIAALLVSLTAGVAHAQTSCLTTLFATNNSGNLGGAIYFDVNVLHPNGICIQSLETNTSSTAAMSVDVYLLDGGGTGEGNVVSGTWSLVSSGSGTGQGVDVPTPVDVVDFSLAPGLHSMALVMDAATQHNYTNGDSGLPWGSGGNQLVANADLEIRLGGASNVPFTGGVFQPRVWNGTICYREGSECFLLVGLNNWNYSLGNDPILVEPLLVIPMTLSNLPSIDVPNNNAFVGLSIYVQSFLYNTLVYPSDPIKVSKGLNYKIGVSTTLYGPTMPTNSILMWPEGQAVATPGSTIRIGFALP